jgi:multimeric flavodoxin WrbA
MRKLNNLFSRVYKKEESHKHCVLGISSSPRVEGNSEILLDKVLEAAAGVGFQTKKFRINDYKFVACQSCEEVRDDGYCRINDDFQKLYQQINQADIVILSSPIFFGSLTAQAKMMIDRFQCHWRAACLLKSINNKPKKGYFLCVQADTRDEYFDNAILIVRNFFATAGIKYMGELLCKGIDEKGSISDSPGTLKQAFALGQSLIE